MWKYKGYGFLPFHGFRPYELEGLLGNKVNLLAKTALEGFASYRGSYVKELMKNKKRWNKWLRIHFSTCEEFIPSYKVYIFTSIHIKTSFLTSK